MLIGSITLNLSSTIYLFWLLPQIILNFKRKDTEGLSLFMHGILCIGYLCDLIYGFGLHMQWQYRMVSIAGLCSLAVQHYQFGRYGLHQSTEKYIYLILNVIFLVMLSYAIFTIHFLHQKKSFYDFSGIISSACWLCYMLPQIIKNYRDQSVIGLSPYFVMLAIFLNISDSTSAWSLGWDYPSKIGSAISFVGNSILLSQVFYYGKFKKFRMAFDS